MEDLGCPSLIYQLSKALKELCLALETVFQILGARFTQQLFYNFALTAAAGKERCGLTQAGEVL